MFELWKKIYHLRLQDYYRSGKEVVLEVVNVVRNPETPISLKLKTSSVLPFRNFGQKYV